MAIRVSETIYFVRNLDVAIAFYTEKIGFKLEKKYDWGFAVLDVDGSKVALMLESAWEREYPDTDDLPKPRIALQTDDFEGTMHHFTEMGIPHNTMRGARGKHRSATIYDHDENPIYLWSDPEEPMS